MCSVWGSCVLAAGHSRRWSITAQPHITLSANMAAPTGPKGSQAFNPSSFEGFPFAVAGRPLEESSGKEQEQAGDVKKKPCRACTDFKTWMKVQKKQAVTAVQVTWGQGGLAVYLEDMRGSLTLIWLVQKICSLSSFIKLFAVLWMVNLNVSSRTVGLMLQKAFLFVPLKFSADQYWWKWLHKCLNTVSLWSCRRLELQSQSHNRTHNVRWTGKS